MEPRGIKNKGEDQNVNRRRTGLKAGSRARIGGRTSGQHIVDKEDSTPSHDRPLVFIDAKRPMHILPTTTMVESDLGACRSDSVQEFIFASAIIMASNLAGQQRRLIIAPLP